MANMQRGVDDTDRREFRRGLGYAFGAFAFWGVVLPVYTKLLKEVPAFEILAHRVLWGALAAGALLFATRGWSAARHSLTWRGIAALAVSAALVTTNWTVYIIAVLSEHIVDASLGYFLNPLVSIALGMAFLGERLRPLQALACAVAAAGVAVPILVSGGVPWIALTLAFSFGLYGLVRKVVRVDALVGFFVEVALLTPLAAAYLVVLAVRGEIVFSPSRPGLDLLLAGAGVVTAIPLILFSAGARRLPLTMLGLLQFTSPSMTLLLGVFLYGEPFTWVQGATFGCIWTACAITIADALLRRPQPLAARRAEAA
jgi:chloramphenicol-sensitive protein RarD